MVSKGTSKGGKPKLIKKTKEILGTIKDVMEKEFLLFSREEAGWILDITHDYIQMIKHTKANSEELRKGYENFLKPDVQLPEGITAEQVAKDLESLKEDVKFLDVAEKRTTILRDAAQNFIMSLPDEDENTKQESTTGHTETDADAGESVHEVPEVDTPVL